MRLTVIAFVSTRKNALQPHLLRRSVGVYFEAARRVSEPTVIVLQISEACPR